MEWTPCKFCAYKTRRFTSVYDRITEEICVCKNQNIKFWTRDPILGRQDFETVPWLPVWRYVVALYHHTDSYRVCCTLHLISTLLWREQLRVASQLMKACILSHCHPVILMSHLKVKSVSSVGYLKCDVAGFGTWDVAKIAFLWQRNVGRAIN